MLLSYRFRGLAAGLCSLLAVALSPSAAAAPTNPLCPGRVPTYCPNVGSSGGDVSGPYYLPKVTGIQTVPVSATLPTLNQFFQFSGGQWNPFTLILGGDVAGPYAATSVLKIRGITVNPTPPIAGQVLGYDGVQLTYTTPSSTAITEIYLGGNFNTPPNLTAGLPQYIALGGASAFPDLNDAVIRHTAMSATNFACGSSNQNAGFSIVCNLVMSTDDGATWPVVATVTIPPLGRFQSVALGPLAVPANARFQTQVSITSGTFVGGLSSVVTGQ